MFLFSRSSITRLSYDDKILRSKEATVKETIAEEKVIYFCSAFPEAYIQITPLTPIFNILFLVTVGESIHIGYYTSGLYNLFLNLTYLELSLIIRFIKDKFVVRIQYEGDCPCLTFYYT